jgi:predicted amidophosphoribosyltransferase
MNFPGTTHCTAGGIPFIIRVGTYSGELKNLIVRYKKTGVRGLAKPIAALMSQEIDRVIGNASRVAVIPVPCSEHSRRTRGWDHMVLVGKALSAKPKCMLIQVLERQGSGELKTMGKQQRELESSRSYRLRKNLGRRELAVLESCTIALVIDDVMTTGSTFGTCISLVAGIVDIRILGLCLAMD